MVIYGDIRGLMVILGAFYWIFTSFVIVGQPVTAPARLGGVPRHVQVDGCWARVWWDFRGRFCGEWTGVVKCPMTWVY